MNVFVISLFGRKSLFLLPPSDCLLTVSKVIKPFFVCVQSAGAAKTSVPSTEGPRIWSQTWEHITHIPAIVSVQSHTTLSRWHEERGKTHTHTYVYAVLLLQKSECCSAHCNSINHIDGWPITQCVVNSLIVVTSVINSQDSILANG